MVDSHIYTSQSHRMAEVGRDLWGSSGPSLLLQQSHPALVPRAMSRWLLTAPGGKVHNLFGHPVPVLVHSHSKSVCSCSEEPPVYQWVHLTSGPFAGHLWEEPGSIPLAPSLQGFRYMDKIPSEHSLLKSNLPQLSQPSPMRDAAES